MVHAGKHSKECGNTHYNMEVCDIKISIVQMNI